MKLLYIGYKDGTNSILPNEVQALKWKGRYETATGTTLETDNPHYDLYEGQIKRDLAKNQQHKIPPSSNSSLMSPGMGLLTLMEVPA